MHRIASLFFLAALIILWPFKPGTVQAENIGSVEVKSATIIRCHKLAQDPQNTVPQGFLELASLPSGKSYLILHLKMKLIPGKDEDGDDLVKVEDESIRLVDSAGKGIASIGACTRDGRFSSYSSGYSYYGKPEDRLYHYHPVFIIPDGTQTYTLKMNQAEFLVEPPKETQETIDRSSVATFQVEKVVVVDKLEFEEEFGESDSTEVKVEIESTVKKYLVVHLVIKPKLPNNESNGFDFASADFGVLYGAQVYASSVGSFDDYDGEFISGNASYGSESDTDGSFETQRDTIVFPLPGRITKFKVLYLLDEVASGTVPN